MFRGRLQFAVRPQRPTAVAGSLQGSKLVTVSSDLYSCRKDRSDDSASNVVGLKRFRTRHESTDKVSVVDELVIVLRS
jgi:hypothetical protein